MLFFMLLTAVMDLQENLMEGAKATEEISDLSGPQRCMILDIVNITIAVSFHLTSLLHDSGCSLVVHMW